MALLSIATTAALFSTVAAAAPKPHVVFILADDYGWANLGVHRRGLDSSADALQGRAEVHTPHLDALIDAGILLDQHYAYKICSPSRNSLQSGRLAVHVNVANTGVTAHNASDPVSGFAGMPRNMTGVAQKLAEAGYRTHAVGKWDVGMATPEHTPLGRGYETWLGYFQHANDYWRKNTNLASTGEVDNCLNSFTDLFMYNSTYRGGVRDAVSLSDACRQNPESDPGCYEEHIFKERVLSLVRSHDKSKVNNPLFLFWSFHLLHTPLQVPKYYLQKIDAIVSAAGGLPFTSQNRRLYAAMTLYMDEAIGELVQTLKTQGMWDNTLLVFSSDNGGAIYEPGSGNNHPLKGGKYSDWQGGVRTNAFVSGGFIPSEKRGSTFAGVVSIADWYATFCELAGVDKTDHAAIEANKWLKPRNLPLLRAVDGVAQWHFIMNNSNARPGTLHLSENSALRWPYKLVTGKQAYSAWTGELYPNCSTLDSLLADHGPAFIDFKIFNQQMQLGRRPQVNDKLLWTQDCSAGCLVNVLADPTEHLDLAQDPSHAEIFAALQEDLHTLNKDLFKPYRGDGGIQACTVAVDNGGFLGPFVDIEGWYSEVSFTLEEKVKNKIKKVALEIVNTNTFQTHAKRAATEAVPAIRQVLFRKYSDVCLHVETVFV